MRQLKITKQVTNRETASLDKYLQEIGKVDLISADDRYSFTKNSIALGFCLTTELFFNKVSKSLILLFFINHSILIFKNSSESKFF